MRNQIHHLACFAKLPIKWEWQRRLCRCTQPADRKNVDAKRLVQSMEAKSTFENKVCNL